MTRTSPNRAISTQVAASLVRRTAAHLMQMLRVHDAYTARHAQRVAVYADAVVRALGLPPDQADQIRLAALLHDIGKLITDRSLLGRPGALTPRERYEVLMHTVWGAQLLDLVLRHHRAALEAVQSHHERVDGMGFPNRLRANRIPLGARIIAVVDAFDAMTSSRPYRSALPPARAVRELQQEASVQFDPVCVTAFIGVLNSVAPRALHTLRVGAVFLALSVRNAGGTGGVEQLRTHNTGAHPTGLSAAFVGATPAQPGAGQSPTKLPTSRAPPPHPPARRWAPARGRQAGIRNCMSSLGLRRL